jgi:hypothetical protein
MVFFFCGTVKGEAFRGNEDCTTNILKKTHQVQLKKQEIMGINPMPPFSLQIVLLPDLSGSSISR